LPRIWPVTYVIAPHYLIVIALTHSRRDGRRVELLEGG
jgi:ribosomal protein S16